MIQPITGFLPAFGPSTRHELPCERGLGGSGKSVHTSRVGPATARAVPRLKSRGPSCVLDDKDIYPATDPNRPPRDGSGLGQTEVDQQFSGSVLRRG
ncbi:hypothetical protein BHM03_00043727 [Ensete ventricosum]|nr:hypothetical protein BHM03_00043727 [Ensete ventricosum]